MQQKTNQCYAEQPALSLTKGSRSILFALLLMLCMAACKQEPDCSMYKDPINIPLYGPDSLKMPYTGHDTLVYQRTDTNGNVLDTVTLIGTGSTYKYEYLDEIQPVPECMQKRNTTICTMSFKDASGVHFEYKYVTKETGTYLYLTFQKSLNFEFTSRDINNRINDGHISTYDNLGKTHYDVNKIPAFQYTVADNYYLIMTGKGEILRICNNQMIYNLIEQ